MPHVEVTFGKYHAQNRKNRYESLKVQMQLTEFPFKVKIIVKHNQKNDILTRQKNTWQEDALPAFLFAPPFFWQRVSRDGNCVSSMLHAGKTPSEALCMQHYRFISPNKLGLVANTNAVVPLHSLLPLQWQDSANLCFSSSSPPAEAELLQGSYSSLLGTGDQYQISFCSKY